MSKRMLKTLESTKFKDSPIVAVAANPGGSEAESSQSIGLQDLIATVRSYSYLPRRNPNGDFLFAVDHCFSIKGQGTVMTGTVLHGTAAINDTVEISSLKVTKKVKSMQMFHKSVKSASQGDRVGICVTQFDPKLLERGLVCTPGCLPTLYGAVVEVHKIPYFKSQCLAKSKFHITVGYETVMARLQFFGSSASSTVEFSFDSDYIYQEELSPDTCALSGRQPSVKQYVLLEFEHPIICQANSLLIGSRLDSDINLNTCRLAFYGRIVAPFLEQDYMKTSLPKLKIYKTKERAGIVERVQDDYTVIVKSLFKKETNLELFTNMKVSLSSGEEGKIEGGFGQSGKVKVSVPRGVGQSTKDRFASAKRSKGKKDEDPASAKDLESVSVTLKFKKYLFDAQHKMVQC